MNEITRRINKKLRFKAFIEDFSYLLISDEDEMYIKIDVEYTDGKYLSKLINVDAENIEVTALIDFILNYYYEN